MGDIRRDSDNGRRPRRHPGRHLRRNAPERHLSIHLPDVRVIGPGGRLDPIQQRLRERRAFGLKVGLDLCDDWGKSACWGVVKKIEYYDMCNHEQYCTEYVP